MGPVTIATGSHRHGDEERDTDAAAAAAAGGVLWLSVTIAARTTGSESESGAVTL